MATSSAGVLPPVDTWHPQVWRWVHAAWERNGGLEGGKIPLSELVRALWSAGDPWSRAYRNLFAGAPAPARRLALATPEDEVFYAGEPDLVDVMEAAAQAGAGRIHPWALLRLVAERTQGSAQKGRPGWPGVRSAPVEANGEGTIVRAQHGAQVDDVVDWAGGRQVVAVLFDERVSSGAERFATPYVEGHFYALAEDRWVLREPAENAPFWVLEGVAPDAAEALEQGLREARRRVPGFVPWVPLRSGIDAARADALARTLAPLRTLPRLLLTTDPGTEAAEDQAQTLVVALDRLTGGQEELHIAPVMADRPHRDDVLGHDALAAQMVATLTEEATDPPVVVSILGPSGSGRSDLLSRLHDHWNALEPPLLEQDERGPPYRVITLDPTVPLHAQVHGHPEDVDPVEVEEETTTDRSDRTEAVLGLVLPGATSPAPRSAQVAARTGLMCATLGAAGVLATSGHWSALIPAALLGVGTILAARGIGQGLFAEASDEDDEYLPAPASVVVTPEPISRLLLLLDDLDRVTPEVAQSRLHELRELVHDSTVPTVAILGCQDETLRRACTPEHPPEIVVQVPLWLPPLRGPAIRQALAAWTGLPAPTGPRSTPRLHAVDTPEDLPAAVPIQVEVDELAQVGPADLQCLAQLAELAPPTPRAWRSLVNQVRLLRPNLPVAVSAPAVSTWLVLAAADPQWARNVRSALSLDADVGALIRELAPIELRQAAESVDPAFWPDAEDLITASDPVLRWTFAGPYAPAFPEVPAIIRTAAS